MSFSISRLTSYVVLSAIEDDLRNIILENLGHLEVEKIFNELTYKKAVDRVVKDLGVQKVLPDLIHLLIYLDFGDLYQVINENRSSTNRTVSDYVKKITPALERLVPVRNRVAHSRPLKYDDLSIILDTAEDLVQNGSIPWSNLKTTLQRLKDEPSFVLSISIPSYLVDDGDVLHNLPIPDFDETGFLGRRRQVDELVKLCLGPYPVLTIVGEGGIGKTAIALKVAYDILDLKDCPFDAVVWTSSKTSQLTYQEIVRIQGAISDSLGMFQDVAQQLGGVSAGNNHLEEVLEYLGEFKILLILDNLETVLDDRIRSFLEKLPPGSKVLITSRIGIGAFEFPYRLLKMDEEDAVQLLRALLKIRGVEKLFPPSPLKLAEYCNRLKNNPGFIKWFVSAVQAGIRPEEVLARTDIFLEFCMSNVYRFLSEDARKVLRSMLGLPGKHSQAELAFINDLEALSLQVFLHELLRTNMVNMSSTPVGSSFETTYELSDLARQYLANKHPVNSNEFEIFTRKNRQIVAAAEQLKADQVTDPYNFYSIHMRSKSDLIVAKYLMEALKEARNKGFEKADTLISEAQRLAPEYFEVYRVEAIVKFQQDNYTAAQKAYEQAIELEPRSAPIRKWYGSFLLRYIGDCESALIQLNKAAEIDPRSLEIQVEVSRANLYLSRYEEAISILEKIIARSAINIITLRKAYDLLMQCYLRRAEDYLSQHDEITTLSNLEISRTIFISCPRNVVDKQMVNKLKIAINLAEGCCNISPNEESRKQAKQLIDNLIGEYTSATSTPVNFSDVDAASEETGLDRINGTIRVKRDSFGFIDDDRGRTYFFHRFDMLNADAGWSFVKVGDKVSFIAGVDPKNPQGKKRAFKIVDES